MEDTLWSEIADAPDEIFDIPEDFDRNRFHPEDTEQTFNKLLNTKFDF